MKWIIIAIVAAILAVPLTEYKQAQLSIQHNEQRQVEINRELDQTLIKRAKLLKQKKAEEQAKLKAKAEAKALAAKPKPPSIWPAGSCYDAISRQWPPALRDGARVVLEYENSKGDPNAVGVANWDGSRDHGCFQINDKSHPVFFATKDWRDPDANAKYALQIYNERGDWTAWYAVRGILW